jgi:hypothetical protein
MPTSVCPLKLLRSQGHRLRPWMKSGMLVLHVATPLTDYQHYQAHLCKSRPCYDFEPSITPQTSQIAMTQRRGRHAV